MAGNILGSLFSGPIVPNVPDMWDKIEASEAHKQLMQAMAQANNDAMLYGQGVAGVSQLAQQHVHTTNAQQPNDVTQAPSQLALATRARELFVNRMRGVRDSGFKLKLSDFIACHIYQDRVYLFFMLNGKEGVVQEQIDIFPSDMLLSQFRMILAC